MPCHMPATPCECHSVYVEGGGRLLRASSLLPPCLFGGLNLGSRGDGKCLYLLGHLAALSPSVLIKGAKGWFLGYLMKYGKVIAAW